MAKKSIPLIIMLFSSALSLMAMNKAKKTSPLNNAIQKGRVDTVKEILQKGVSLCSNDFRTPDTPLTCALEAFNSLEDRINPLFKKRDYEQLRAIVILLLECGINVNQCGAADYGTPLDIVLKGKVCSNLPDKACPESEKLTLRKEILKILLAYGADATIPNIFTQMTPLEFVKNDKALKELFDDQNRHNQEIETKKLKIVIGRAIRSNDVGVIKKILSLNKVIDSEYLRLAKQYNRKYIGRLLLNRLRFFGPFGACCKGPLAKNGVKDSGLPVEIINHIVNYL